MLCGYLPFDDDPGNPDGENITRLYKYILETRLEFPPQVSPSAQHLLKRLLVPDPSKRATLEEIIAHPWLKPVKHYFDEDGSASSSAEDLDGSNTLSRKETPYGTGKRKNAQASAPPTTTAPATKTTHRKRSRQKTEDPQFYSDGHRGKSLDIARDIMDPTSPASGKTPLPPSMITSPPQKRDMSKSTPHLPLVTDASKDEEVDIEVDDQAHEEDDEEVVRLTVPGTIGSNKGSLDDTVYPQDSVTQTTVDSNSSGSPRPSHYPSSAVISRLKFHHGPIDQRALSAKDPWTLINDISRELTQKGMHVSYSSSQPCRIKVIRPSSLPIQAAPGGSNERKALKPKGFGMGYLMSLPLNLIQRLKYMATFGPAYNSGFDGSETGSSISSASSSASNHPRHPRSESDPDLSDELRFYVEIQRIKNLEGLYLVEFKRLKGNIWGFKRLYSELVGQLPVKDGKFVI